MIKPNNPKRRPHLDESGFTLLEIIAVIVILSIMAVVAVPKYFDLQDQAREKTLKTALAEGIGRVNGYFAEQVLGGARPSEINYNATTLGDDLGDFTMTISADGDADSNSTTFNIRVEGKEDTPLENFSDNRDVTKPGF